MPSCSVPTGRLLGAAQFRDAIQHTASSCTPATGGPAGPTRLAWIALTINLVGFLLAAVTGIAGSRRTSPRHSMLVLASTITAASMRWQCWRTASSSPAAMS